MWSAQTPKASPRAPLTTIHPCDPVLGSWGYPQNMETRTLAHPFPLGCHFLRGLGLAGPQPLPDVKAPAVRDAFPARHAGGRLCPMPAPEAGLLATPGRCGARMGRGMSPHTRGRGGGGRTPATPLRLGLGPGGYWWVSQGWGRGAPSHGVACRSLELVHLRSALPLAPQAAGVTH